jgi:anti-sigma regulatory factor (Ser/Thr protein kinase)
VASTSGALKVVERELAPRPGSAAEARSALDALGTELSEETLDDMRLLVSELVTNVIRHGELDPHDRLLVRVVLRERSVRAEVTQPGPPFRPRVATTPARVQESGWGLKLLELLTDRWGVRSDPTCVWFELSRDSVRSRSE